LRIEYRWAKANMADWRCDLVGLRVAVVMAGGDPAAPAAKARDDDHLHCL
jgi:hypothetical protein